jgi:serine/threonine protein kinase
MSNFFTPPLPGDIVQNYTIIETLGVGGNATVYKAEHPELGFVAFKVLHPGKTTIEDRKRFNREFASLQELSHQNIVKVLESNVHNGYPWISMELIQGSDLDHFIMHHNGSEDEYFEILEEIFIGLCRALEYVHKKNMIHRDLKPSNVLLTKDFVPKLTDFGVVKAPSKFQSEITTMGRLLGTIAFMAPEHILGEPVDHRVDLYSLGALLYMGLTKEKPFKTTTIANYLSQHITKPPPNPKDVNAKVPTNLCEIALKLLEKKPQNRYASAKEILEVLEIDDIYSLHVIGQEDIFERFRNYYHQFQKGNNRTFTIIGDRRSGKTTLLQAIKSQLHENEIYDFGISSNRKQIVFIDDTDLMSLQDQRSLQQDINSDLDIVLIVHTVTEPSCIFSQGRVTQTPNQFHQIQPLSEAQIHTLLRSKGLMGSALIRLTPKLYSFFQGNPGLTLASFDEMTINGTLIKKGKKWRLDKKQKDSFTIPIPRSLQDKYAKTRKTLNAYTLQIIECLVVLGTEASIEQLTSLTDLEIAQINNILPKLEKIGWIEKEDKHAITTIYVKKNQRDILKSFIDSDRIKQWHLRIAGVIRKRCSRNVNRFVEVIAHHLISGDQYTKAIPYLLTLSQQKLQQKQYHQLRELLIEQEKNLHLFDSHKYRRIYYELKLQLSLYDEDIQGSIQAGQKALEAANEEENFKRKQEILLQLQMLYIEIKDVHNDVYAYFRQFSEEDVKRNQSEQRLAIYAFEDGNILLASNVWSKLKQRQNIVSHMHGTMGEHLIQYIRNKDVQALNNIIAHLSSLSNDWLPILLDILISRGDFQTAKDLLTDFHEKLTHQNKTDSWLLYYITSMQGIVCLLCGDAVEATLNYNEYENIPVSSYPKRITVQALLAHELLGFLLRKTLSNRPKPTIEKKEWNTTSRYQIAINNIYHIEKKILNPVRKISLPWLQSQWIVDFALSIDNTMTFSEKFEHRYWQFFEEYEYYGHMILVSYHRISIQKPWEAKADLDVWMNRLSQSLSKCNFSTETMTKFWFSTSEENT